MRRQCGGAVEVRFQPASKAIERRAFGPRHTCGRHQPRSHLANHFFEGLGMIRRRRDVESRKTQVADNVRALWQVARVLSTSAWSFVAVDVVSGFLTAVAWAEAVSRTSGRTWACGALAATTTNTRPPVKRNRFIVCRRPPRSRVLLNQGDR